ncbi:MAG: asparagine synthase-related protein [archaeon GB-1867-005]|nr:asparagine synthase-related protein [Candidatus Culexmicrobium cathedralense]
MSRIAKIKGDIYRHPQALSSDSAEITLTANKLEIEVDAFNMKRIYIYKTSRQLIFSTSLRHIAEIMKKLDLKLKLNVKSTIFYLATGILPIETTIIEGIRKTAPGEKLIIELENLQENSIKRDYIEYGEPPKITENHIEILYNHLLEAVKKRAEDNVKPAVMLSGGIDSALLAALVAKYNENLTAVNLTIPNFYSEYENARKVAEYLNIPIMKIEVKVRENEMVEEHVKAASYIKEPTSRAGFYNHYKIMKEAQEHLSANNQTLTLEQ